METVESAFQSPRPALPTGEVTFLFTDIEGSTVRWERDPTAMQDALRRHDAAMRSAIEASGGVVFKTVGDAFYAAFQEPRAALRSAVDAQLRLEAEDFEHVDGLRVRMALHAGTADERDGDYFGQTLNRVARLLSIGHGGQILLSGAMSERVADALPDRTSLRDMGEHRLKDLTAPERVFQLIAPGLDADFAKLRSLSVLDNNLPQQLTSLIGRDADVAEIKAMFASSSLVTLIGAGGIGKTRSALQVAAELLEASPDGAWFVDFAALTDPALVASTIGATFDVQESASRPMLDSLVAFLKPKKLLLVLDNCEHVIAESSTAASGILRSCPGVKILATSREHLGVAGEALYRMPSLAVPEAALVITADAAREFGAIDLFETRARAASARFVLTDENAPTVAEICRRLDGIPLALELAAARVRVLAPKQLLEKLNERFRVLTGGDRSALLRQQTMRAAIDWSYDLLAPDEQRIFRVLSVFAGSFALDTPAAVCADGVLDELDIFAVVASLADKSLVHAEHGDDTIRYRLLESMRQYGAEKLIEAGERDVAAARHAEAYATVAEEIVADYDTAVHGVWVARVEAEIENVRAALNWAFADENDRSIGLRLAATLHRTMALTHWREAQRYVARAIDDFCDATTEPSLVGRLNLTQAFLNNVSNQFAAVLKHANVAIANFAAIENARPKADAQRLAGRALIYLGDVAAGEALLETALAVHRRLGSRGTGAALRDLALARAAAGDLERSRHLMAESLRDFEQRRDMGNVGQTVGTLAGIEFQAGNVVEALGYAARALEILRALKRRLSVAWILGEMSTFSTALEAFDDAHDRARESLAVALELPSALFTVHALRQLATVAALRPYADDRQMNEHLNRSARVFGFVRVRLAELETALEPVEQGQFDRARERLVAELGAIHVERFEAEGAHLTEERAVWTATSGG